MRPRIAVVLAGAALAAAGGAGTASAALVVGKLGTYRSGFALYAFGEVRNTGPAPAGDVGVEVTLMDRGRRVARGVDLTISTNVLQPGQKAVFYALLSNRPRRFTIRARAVEQVGRDDALVATYTSFRVSGVKLAPSYAGSRHGEVKGTVRNTGAQPARVSEVTVALYNRRGRLIRVGEGQLYPYASTQVIPPGRTAPFEVDILDIARVGRPARIAVHVRAGIKHDGVYYS